MARRKPFARLPGRLGGALALALASTGPFAGASQAASPGVTIFKTHSPATVLVESVGTLFNGTQDHMSGSGLLIGNRVIVTNNHVILDERNYQKLDVTVRIGKRSALPLTAEAFYRDTAADLAIIVLPENLAPDAVDCPVVAMDDSELVPIGSDIFAVGYPLNLDLSVVHGIVSNKSGQNGRWQTDGLINKGNSGGPVFADNGMLIGFAVSGIVNFNGVDVDGINFFIPSTTLLASDLYKKMQEVPQRQQCWGTAVQMAQQAAAVPAAAPAAPDDGGNGPISASILGNMDQILLALSEVRAVHEAPTPVSQSFTVSETKDDHPVVLAPHSKTYERVFPAEEGFKVTACSFAPESAHEAHDIACTIDGDGTAAHLTFRLKSGPAVDRWRGWLTGTVVLDEAPIP